MNGFMRLLFAAMLTLTVACSTAPTDDSGSSSLESGSISEFAEFDDKPTDAQSPEASIESEIAAGEPAAADAAPKAQEPDEFSQFDEPQSQPQAAPPEQSIAQAETPPLSLESEIAAVDPGGTAEAVSPGESIPVPAPMPEVSLTEAPPAEAPAPEITPSQASSTGDSSALATITDIQYRANDNGGTVVIEASAPLTFNQRMNPETRQFVIEIPNSRLPRKLKRPFNTRDFAGTIGSIDAYQGRNSTTTRIVVQLRPDSPEPVIQTEGNNLFVVAQPPVDQNGIETTKSADAIPSKLMASENIEEFLSANQNFYGKRVSIETDEADIRDVFRLISEESNVNLIISDDVKGKISLKLKNVPWDQALVMIMKAKRLGYTRAGNVLRIAPIADIKAEEDDAIKVMAAKKANAIFKVHTVQVNYAKVEDLERQIKPLLSAKGSVIADPRTSSLVITDMDENMTRAEALVKALDISPQQVLIESKIVEASDTFQQSVGVNWGASGRPTQLKGIKSSSGALRTLSQLNVTPSLGANSSFGLNFSLGTLDILGDLSASLRLFETQGMVKVISSPRVVTLHNEPAEISQTQEIPLITATLTGATGTPVPTVSFKPVRLRLSVTPQITNDGAIIMSVDVNRETAGAVVDQATQARPINSRAAKTKVIVKSSQTAVIGGIYQNDVTESETRVPGLAHIPVLGWLFKSTDKDKRRNELLIFITPRILGQLEGAPAAVPADGGLEL